MGIKSQRIDKKRQIEFSKMRFEDGWIESSVQTFNENMRGYKIGIFVALSPTLRELAVSKIEEEILDTMIKVVERVREEKVKLKMIVEAKILRKEKELEELKKSPEVDIIKEVIRRKISKILELRYGGGLIKKM